MIEGLVTSVEAGAGGLTGVRLADGTRVRLGEQVTGTQIEADPTGATSVPGLWVAGNLASIQAQVITAVAAGLTAAAAINADLATEDARRITARGR